MVATTRTAAAVAAGLVVAIEAAGLLALVGLACLLAGLLLLAVAGVVLAVGCELWLAYRLWQAVVGVMGREYDSARRSALASRIVAPTESVAWVPEMAPTPVAAEEPAPTVLDVPAVEPVPVGPKAAAKRERARKPRTPKAAKTGWAALTVVQLRSELKRRGLAVSGVKAALVSRLEGAERQAAG